MRSSIAAVAILFLGPLVQRADADGKLKILPESIRLYGPNAVQRILVVDDIGGRIIADRTGQARLRLEGPEIAGLEDGPLLRAKADGSLILIAEIDGRRATASVEIRGTKHQAPPSFRHEIQPILTRNTCNSGACHGALAGKGGLKLSLRGYDEESDYFALTRQVNARRVNPFDPAKSLLLLKPTRTLPHGGGTLLERDDADTRRLYEWIAAGAPGPHREEPLLSRIEVFPSAARLPIESRMRVLVTAHYSDGTSRDVTPWVRFGSSEESVARIDENGQVALVGPGEAGLTVIFGTKVAVIPLTVPFKNEIAALGPTPTNPIDLHVQRKLIDLRLPTSPPCSDGEFLRRAYLDTAGILPTPQESAAFLADTSPNKRAVWINKLLERPEFIDYWTYKWCDLLLVSTRKLPKPAMLAFYRAVREAVADNRPWDRFAQDLLTASGSNLTDGLGNYFVLHKDIATLTESTAVTFLGMSITCARCHNHPLERWTQDQYWSMANLFSRVGLKNGDKGGEVIVHPLPIGDVLHPRRNIAPNPAPLDAPPLRQEQGIIDRRAYFADWLTAKENPFFAKALVNRVWRNFFGRGLVEPEDDLRETNPPSNRELFDALTTAFIANGYDVKELMRLILNSQTYQRSAQPVPGNEADDRFGSHYLVKRLPAEVILDAYSQITGVPTPFDKILTGVEGGTAATGDYPIGMRALQLPDVRIASRFLEAFGRPDRMAVCSCERSQDATVGQALHLNNGQTLNEKLRSPNSRLSEWLQEGIDEATMVKRLFRMALCREPTPAELGRLTKELSVAPHQAPTARRERLEDLFWAVLTSREFLFNH